MDLLRRPPRDFTRRIRSRDVYILLLEGRRIKLRKKEKKEKERKKERRVLHGKETRCFVVTDEWTIKLQGEISSDCRERNPVTAAGRERERSVRLGGRLASVRRAPRANGTTRVTTVVPRVCIPCVNTLSRDTRGHKTAQYMAR